MTETNKPLVSIVIPAYNAAAFIRQAVDSVLAQTWDNPEVLVVNDGSTDDTAHVLREYGTSIRIVDKPNGGLSSARNRGIEEAKGKYIAFLDADDHWLPEKLARQVEVLEANPTVGFCSTKARFESPEGTFLNEWECPKIQGNLLKTLFLQNGAIPGSGSGVMVRRTLFDHVGLFDESLRSLEDIDMWMRLAAVTDYRCIDEPLTVIIKHPDSMSRNLDVMRESAKRVMTKNRRLLPQNAQGRLWHCGYASMLSDYAKWEYREGRKWRAIGQLIRGFLYCPTDMGRTCSMLALAIILNKRI